jgi:hypothetical protein
MEDLQKLVEQWAKSAGLANQVMTPWLMEMWEKFARLAMQHAAEEAAKVCENGRLWELLAAGRPMERVGPLDCAAAIRERFKAL